jgi:hypothetical protein
MATIKDVPDDIIFKFALDEEALRRMKVIRRRRHVVFSP